MSGKTNEPVPESMPAGPYEPLTDEQLDRLFKAARPTPPPEWQKSFWQDLESKLEQPARPAAHVASAGIRWIKQPWTAAAAALVIILLALPMSQQLADQTDKSALDQLDKPELSSKQAPPLTLGAGHPAAPGNPASRSDGRKETAPRDETAVREREQQEQHLEAPAQAGSQSDYQAAGAVPLQDKSRKNSVAMSEESKQKMARSHAQNLKADPKPARQKLDALGARLEAMILPLNGELQQLQPGHYEIKVPASHQQELEFLIQQLAPPHNKLIRALKDHDQLVYRLDIL